MTYAMNIKTIAIAAALSLSAIVTAPTGAQAMTLHNCTDWSLPVQLEDRTGDTSRRAYLEPFGTQRIHATSSFGPYRIILPTLGAGAHFSGRSGDGTFSLIQTGGGNIGIRNGHACPQPVAPPPPSGGGNGELCFTNANGFEVCLRQ